MSDTGSANHQGSGKYAMKTVPVLAITALCVTALVAAAFAQTSMFRKKRPAYHEYANVVMNNFSEKKKIAPVVFNHWLHRAKYTCKVCHVDLKFAMKAGLTRVTEESNEKGLYCGACHNGKEAFGSVKSGTAGAEEVKECRRCHSYGQAVEMENNFYRYTKDFPRGRFGNGVDWLEAEKRGLVTLKDSLEGVTLAREEEKRPGEEVIKPRIGEMPEIIFSHDKHAVWNGCELCHPVPFNETKGGTKFTMEQIFEGKFCGTCHGKVSFSTLDCQRCHVKRVL